MRASLVISLVVATVAAVPSPSLFGRECNADGGTQGVLTPFFLLPSFFLLSFQFF